MNFIPLVLSAKRQSWRLMDGHAGEADRAFRGTRQEILARDDYTCRGCGFRAEKCQEVHHLDDDHQNNNAKNLVTMCCLCHQCFHLGMAGMRRSGLIIWLPEIKQRDLNIILRALFVAVKNARKHAEAASNLYAALESRAQLIENELGAGSSNPAAIGQALLDMSPAQYARRAERFAGLRLLARPVGFVRQISYWHTDPKIFGSLADEDWERVADFETFAKRREEDGAREALVLAPALTEEAGGEHDDTEAA